MIDAETYEVIVEVQTVLGPDNVDTVLSGVDHFVYEWEDASMISNFVFEPEAMVLKYDTGENYDVKPLEIGVVLPIHATSPASAPDPANADILDLEFVVPTPVDIGAISAFALHSGVSSIEYVA